LILDTRDEVVEKRQNACKIYCWKHNEIRLERKKRR